MCGSPKYTRQRKLQFEDCIEKSDLLIRNETCDFFIPNPFLPLPYDPGSFLRVTDLKKSHFNMSTAAAPRAIEKPEERSVSQILNMIVTFGNLSDTK